MATHRIVTWLSARLITLARVHLTLLLIWAVLRAFAHDGWWWLFFANSFAVYLFFPLPLILPVALLTRRRELWFGLIAASLIGVYLFGGLFLPKQPAVPAGSPALTVMTYNVLGFNENVEGIVGVIRASDADIVALQEINPLVAEALQRDLAREYPYQSLDPQWGVIGMGVISRYPLRPHGERLEGEAWVGRPQVLTLDWNGAAITVLHFHPTPPGFSAVAQMQWSVRERERQARSVVDFVARQPGPLIAPVDFNANDQSEAYAIVTRALVDAWREAGWGLGHTFPGADSPGSSRPRLANISVPMWLSRIDHIFYTPHLKAVAAWIGPFDGVSDHRPVVARLVLVKP